MCPPRASHLQYSGEASDQECIDPGIWFHLARGQMRWRTGDTCLSAASCVPCPPPLAAIRKLSGTIPASPALLSGSSPRTPPTKRQATSPAARLDPFTASRISSSTSTATRNSPSPHHSTPHTDQNGEPPPSFSEKKSHA